MPNRIPACAATNSTPASPERASRAAGHPLDVVTDALSRMRFGVIQLTVHDGRLVQVDVTERSRFA